MALWRQTFVRNDQSRTGATNLATKGPMSCAENRAAPSTALDVWVVSRGVTRYVRQGANNIATPLAIDV